MAETQSSRVVPTTCGEYLVQGLDSFAVAGDLRRELATTAERYHHETGAPPDAIVWDDGVLEFRSFNLTFSLLRVFVPFTDPHVVSALDNRARVAIRLSTGSDYAVPDVNEALRGMVQAGRVAHAPGLLRFIGWPEQAPIRAVAPARPAQSAKSISVVINYRDKAAATLESLAQIRKQQRSASLELILVDNQSRPAEREAVEEGVSRLFGDAEDVRVRHVRYDAPFNHSYQCNFGASLSSGSVLVMMSNDCQLIDDSTLQALADWSLEPGIGGVMPRIVGAAGAITSAGVAIQPEREEKRDEGEGRRALRIQDCEVEYLSRTIRQTAAVTFACAAISRTNWFAAGGLDAIGFPADYNDADFSLRCTALGLRHLYLGNVEAYHQAGRGDRRTREQSEAVLAQLLRRHDLQRYPASNPYGIRLRRMPNFNDDAANEVLDLIRLYRLAHGARSNESGVAGDLRFLRSFEALVAAADLARDAAADPLDRADIRARHASLYQKIRAVCQEYIRVAPMGAVSQRQAESFEKSDQALARIEQIAARESRGSVLPPADSGAASPQSDRSRLRLSFAALRRGGRGTQNPDPDPAADYYSFSDKSFEQARQRLLVFADGMGPTQQYTFQIALNRARRAGEVALRIFTEQDIGRLVAAHGDSHCKTYFARTVAHMAPTVVVFSRFGDYRARPLLVGPVAGLPQVFLIDDDLFATPATAGIDRYRSARTAKRVSAMVALASSADLVIASSTVLAERMRAHAGATPIAVSGLLAGGRPFADPTATRPPKIGYVGSASHAADLAMIAPALKRLREDFPAVPIEIRGPVADSPAALSLGDTVIRDAGAESDYGLFRKAMAGYGWSIGLAPLQNTEFNRAKLPVKWVEYTEAGIATVASKVETYQSLGRSGALLLAAPDEWYGRVAELLSRDDRRQQLLVAANRAIDRDYAWPGVETRLLALLDRARAMKAAEANAYVAL